MTSFLACNNSLSFQELCEKCRTLGFYCRRINISGADGSQRSDSPDPPASLGSLYSLMSGGSSAINPFLGNGFGNPSMATFGGDMGGVGSEISVPSWSGVDHIQ